jgi:Domain of unknown function (DUF4396)
VAPRDLAVPALSLQAGLLRGTVARGMHDHAHHEVVASLNRLAVSATNHCLTGCLTGEVVGMVIATALGWGNAPSIALAVGLAFLFGYALTSIPLIKAGLAAAVVVSTALASDTISIAIMEFIDNLFVLLVPGAMEAGLTEALFWLPLLGGFVIAWPFAFAVNKALIRRGKGHAVVHQYH